MKQELALGEVDPMRAAPRHPSGPLGRGSSLRQHIEVRLTVVLRNRLRASSTCSALAPSSAGVDHARKRHRGDELIVADLLAVAV